MKKYNRRKILLGSMLSVATAVKLILPIPVMAEETYCGHEAHQHTDECREEVHAHADSCYESNLNCQEDHEHDDSCYEKELNCTTAEESGQTEYICDKEEHTHSLECYADLTADIETEEDWEKTLPKKAKDTFVETLLDVARSQLKYRESEKNYKVDESGTVKPYSRYGQWIDEPYGEMNLPFVAFVLHYAKAEELPVTWTEGWDEFYRTAKEEELIQLEDHIPYKGDLILLEDTYAEGNYVGFVSSVDPFKAIVADVNGEVQEINLKEAKCEILGYIRPQAGTQEKDADNQPLPELEDDMLEAGDYVIQKQTRLETDSYILTAEVDEQSFRKSEETGALSKLSADETDEKGPEKKQLEIILADPEENPESLEQLKKEIEDFNNQKDKKLEEKLEELSSEADDQPTPMTEPESEEQQSEEKDTSGQDEKISESNQPKEDLTFFQLKVQTGESSLEINDIQINISVLPKEELVQMMDSEKPVLPEVESGMDMTLYSQPEKELVTDETAYQADEPIVDSAEAKIESSQMFAVQSRSTVYPNFTVQYKAQYNEQVTNNSTKGTLPVIETKEGDLPENGTGADTKPTDAEISNLVLDTKGNSYSIKTKSVYKSVFQDKSYNYKEAPNPTYWDHFRANGNYKLSAIWTYDSKSDANKEQNPKKYSPDIHFTNKKETAESKENYVLVTENMYIQMRYEQTTGDNSFQGMLYDYDITNDGKTTNMGTTNSNWGAAYGINSESNYNGQSASNKPGGKAKLAFGNDNTGTHLGRVKWKGNLLNAYNSGTYKGCTFGIVKSFDTVNKKIIYDDGIAVPDLFSEKAAAGKTAYESNLNFKRVGDTYTLDSVSGETQKGEVISAKNLQTFSHPATYTNEDNKFVNNKHIFTNNSWPLDKVNNKDPHTGKTGSRGTWNGWKWVDKTYPKTNNGAPAKGETYPYSDDGKAHNSMFGLHYTVKFTYDKDYVGPLVYTFFGDDDMWVFMDGVKVIDIGGVHSSVGQRVDLRSYLPEVGDGKEHTLEFFYTERGLSGSTCYMQFTLPSVTSVKPEYQAGDLRIEKVTDGVESGRTFTFDLKLEGCLDDYNYKIYQKGEKKEDDQLISSDLITSDGGQIEFQSGQYALISHLPENARYTITENSEGSYMVSTSSDGIKYMNGNSITGTISSGNTAEVWFKNAWSSMPATGQRGILLPVVTGLGIATVSATIIIRKRRK